MIGKHSIKEYFDELKKNWSHLKENYATSQYILSTINGKNYNQMRGLSPLAPETKILEMTVMMFFLALIIELFLWIYALMYFIQYYNSMPTWARVISIMGLSGVIPGGSLITFAVVYFSHAK